MHHFKIDECAEDRGNAKTHVWYQRHFWSWTGPVDPRCWLLGHKPRLRWNGGSSYVECGRCPARPFDIQGMQAVRVRLGNLRPGHDNFATARSMKPPTPEEEAFIIREISGRGAWSQNQQEFKVEIPIRRKPTAEFSLRFHVGSRGSETPWDGHLTVGGTGIYWGLGMGGHLAHRITGGRGRDVGLALHDRQVWWKLWADPDSSSRDQPKWWEGNFTVDPTEWIWGRRRYTYDDVGAPVTLDLFETAEGTVHYDVVLQLQRGWRGWVKRPRPRGRDRWLVTWDSKTGLPFRHHEWKGDEVYGSSVELTDAEARSKDWTRYAAEKLRADMTADRLRYGWSKDRWERDRAEKAARG